MYHKIVNKFDVDCLEQCMYQSELLNASSSEIKASVMASIKDTVGIFDEYYGASRHPENDLGGFVIFMPTIHDTELFYAKILDHYNLTEECAESIDIVADWGNIKFIQQTYLLSSDFGIVLVLPMMEV